MTTQPAIGSKLYKKDSGGSWRVWWGELVEDGYNMYHGQENGQIQERFTPVYSGKNIGKANETSPIEQAELELESKYRKQLDKGYATAKVNNVRISPMLAHRYDKYPARISFPAYVQPKLDGTRCLIYKVDGQMKAFTRNGKEYKTVGHICDELGTIDDSIIWDGELYVHGEDFQSLISAIKRDKSNEASKKLEFHVYDAIPQNHGLEFGNRLVNISRVIHGKKVRGVKTILVNDEASMYNYHAEFLRDGYEGTIIRNLNGLYQFGKRSYDLQKVKDFNDGEFTIVGFKTDKDNCCVFCCETDEGYNFDVRPEGTVEVRQQYITDFQHIVGKKLTVRYFGMTTSTQSVPRFPVGVVVRDYE